MFSYLIHDQVSVGLNLKKIVKQPK